MARPEARRLFPLKYRTTLKMPGYLKEMGLDCFEYQCGRGVNIGKEACIALGKQAEKMRYKAFAAFALFH